MFYVYKIKSKHTDHYYVGVSLEYRTRIRNHELAINKLVNKIRAKETIEKGNPFYLLIAQQVYDREKKRKYNNVSEHVESSLLLECETPEKASEMETFYISERPEYCLNTLKKSYYRYSWGCEAGHRRSAYLKKEMDRREAWRKEVFYMKYGKNDTSKPR